MIKPGSFISGLAVIAAATMTTSCSAGSAQAPRTSTSTVTASPSASAPSSPAASPSPTFPSAAQQQTPAAAEAFARYVLTTYNYAFWALDPAPLQAISASDCVFCADTVNTVNHFKAEHYRVEGGDIVVKAAVVAPVTPGVSGGVLPALMVIDEAPARTLASDGRVVVSSRVIENRRMEISVRWVGDKWVLL